MPSRDLFSLWFKPRSYFKNINSQTNPYPTLLVPCFICVLNHLTAKQEVRLTLRIWNKGYQVLTWIYCTLEESTWEFYCHFSLMHCLICLKDLIGWKHWYIDPKGESSAITRKTEEVYDISTGKYGLILYNPSDRDGAVKEADTVQSGLQSVGCQVIRAEWKKKAEIYSLIDDGARRAAKGSLLIVCIMSHGTAGTLRSEDGDGCVLINDLMVRLTRNVSEDLHMVREREKRLNFIPTWHRRQAHCIEHSCNLRPKLAGITLAWYWNAGGQAGVHWCSFMSARIYIAIVILRAKRQRFAGSVTFGSLLSYCFFPGTDWLHNVMQVSIVSKIAPELPLKLSLFAWETISRM